MENVKYLPEKKITSDINNLSSKKIKLEEANRDTDSRLETSVVEINSLIATKNELDTEVAKLNEEFERVKLILTPTSRGRLLREKNPTSEEMIGKTCSTRYKRQEETKDLLEYVHGGSDGSIFGAWDYIRRYATEEQLESFVVSFKKGKFVERIHGKFSDTFRKSDAAINQAVASKYQLHLSRRKYSFLCRIQNKTFNPESGTWNTNLIEFGDKNIKLCRKSISDANVEKFVRSLDIGELHSIPGYCGNFRTVTALTTMMIELHLRSDSLRQKLIWFNDQKNHFIVEFSDDGAPESKNEAMCIDSLTLWNFGKRVRSRNYHYPLHTISADEKDNAVALLWQQHTEEMLLLEGNNLFINNEKVTLEFHPSADQAWQFWANNELTQSATYPSMFAKFINLNCVLLVEKLEIHGLQQHLRLGCRI